MIKISKRDIALLAIVIFVCVLLVSGVCIYIVASGKPSDYYVDLPDGYDKNYTENYEDFLAWEEMLDTDWTTFEAEPSLVVNMKASSYGASITRQSSKPTTQYQTLSDIELISLPENEAWTLITQGIFNSYPTVTFSQSKSQLAQLKQTFTTTVTCNVWYWEDPTDDTNFNKVARTKTFAVNKAIADLFQHAMQDIFNHESQPVFNLADTGMGTWVLRNKTGSGGVSAHSIGTAIDINPSTGSFFINGSWWGNGYKQKVITAEMWEQLPECHTKYHVLYDGCPIVETFKAYGFCWGGDWTSVKDPMHISFIADGNDARSVGYNNYKERQK